MDCVIYDDAFYNANPHLETHYEARTKRDKKEAERAYEAFERARQKHEPFLKDTLQKKKYKQFRFTDEEYERFKALFLRKLNKGRNELKKALFESQNGCCAYCCREMELKIDPETGKIIHDPENGKSATVDHLAPSLRKAPKKLGEEPKTRRNWLIASFLHEQGYPEALEELFRFMNRDENVVGCCNDCNRKKGDRFSAEFFYHHVIGGKRAENLRRRQEQLWLSDYSKSYIPPDPQRSFDFG